MRTAAYEPLCKRGVRPQKAPYVDFNLLVLMSFEVTTMGFQEPTCCNKSYLLGS